MALLNKGITIIHFDETYASQRKLQKYSHDAVDFSHMKHVNLYCEENSLKTLKKQLQNRRQKGITFIGNGNYHYVTYLLLQEITKPFTLILFDNHPDLGVNGDYLLSCGSWVSYALSKVPMLRQVVIIGPTATYSFHSTQHRVVIFPFDGDYHYSIKSILSTIQTEDVYISIDKDVLNTAEVMTNWDQGVMDSNTLTVFLNSILHHKQVEGVDVCGEADFSPVQTLLPNYQTIIHKNEKINLKILQTCLQPSHSQHKLV